MIQFIIMFCSVFLLFSVIMAGVLLGYFIMSVFSEEKHITIPKLAGIFMLIYFAIYTILGIFLPPLYLQAVQKRESYRLETTGSTTYKAKLNQYPLSDWQFEKVHNDR